MADLCDTAARVLTLLHIDTRLKFCSTKSTNATVQCYIDANHHAPADKHNKSRHKQCDFEF